MQSLDCPREGRASFRGCLVADGYYIGELLGPGNEMFDGVTSVLRNIQTHFLHGLDDDGVQLAWLDACAFGFESSPAELIEESFRHL